MYVGMHASVAWIEFSSLVFLTKKSLAFVLCWGNIVLNDKLTLQYISLCLEDESENIQASW